jgi:hypothetical protein
LSAKSGPRLWRLHRDAEALRDLETRVFGRDVDVSTWSLHQEK